MESTESSQFDVYVISLTRKTWPEWQRELPVLPFMNPFPSRQPCLVFPPLYQSFFVLAMPAQQIFKSILWQSLITNHTVWDTGYIFNNWLYAVPFRWLQQISWDTPYITHFYYAILSFLLMSFQGWGFFGFPTSYPISEHSHSYPTSEHLHKVLFC